MTSPRQFFVPSLPVKFLVRGTACMETATKWASICDHQPGRTAGVAATQLKSTKLVA